MADVVPRLKAALVADYVVLGGGNAKRLKSLPPDARLARTATPFSAGSGFGKKTLPIASPSHPPFGAAGRGASRDSSRRGAEIWVAHPRLRSRASV